MALFWKYAILAALIAAALAILYLAFQGAARVSPLTSSETSAFRRLAVFYSAYGKPLALAVFALGFLVAAWLVWRTTWGVDAVWAGGSWTPAADFVPSSPGLEVREPKESWIANLFYGLMLGLFFGVSPILVEQKFTPHHALLATVGAGFFLWMVQSAVFHGTRIVQLSDAGLDEITCFGVRRIPWQEIGGVEFQDVRKAIESLNPPDRRTGRTSGLPRIDVWAVKDRGGRNVLSLPAEMTPAGALKALRERIVQRTSGSVPRN